ncbi:outer membrane protein assembly factor BamA [Urechidicola vernalis]|uniref:Outer membrane protein assembly factor BamA n=1 Tax=Urechidicola vernalis TaxID=3075600 RepID=A0ABU2Y4H8_9FLAO|nr:outer membrane protein assembly factor BamA [Urechidicola sp. P050]MDT0553099.1 outer membrane protein assembly factor BamA [Urechidicola sp. P050]
MRYKLSFILFTFLFISTTILAQENVTQDTIKTKETPPKATKQSGPIVYEKGKAYELGGITVTGLQKFSEQAVKVFTGLKVGQEIRIPGDKLSSAIKKLYEQKQFSSVDAYITQVDGNTMYLEFDVQELPQLSNVTFSGIKKSKSKELQKETQLTTGAMMTDNLLVTSQNYIENSFKEKGFLNAKVTLNSRVDSTDTNSKEMLVHIDKGSKIKIKEIIFDGNDQVSDQTLAAAMKNTKTKFFGRFWKGSKFIQDKFDEDLESILAKFSEKGHRDARVLGDSISWNDDNTVNLHIALEEGQKYYFGGITYLGNKVYTDEQLNNLLRINKGEVYNSKVLKERVVGDGSPDSEDIASLYQNSGYIFSQVTPVETRVENDSIYVQVRISEDEPATLKRVTVNGNDKTNDHVAYRQIRTRPGYLYRKDDIIRTIRELGQLGFFDPETITPDLKPNYIDKTVDIDYTVAEKGASQIELQGGYGGGSFIGTLGLSFNNFSIRNIFNKKAYKPLPMGDGQSLSLRLQKSRYYTTSSFSFTEPWLGGKKPQSLSFSIYNSKQYRYNYVTRDVDKDQRLDIIGASVGLGKRLSWPDDYFTLSQTVSLQRYDLKDYPIGSFTFDTGISNNLSYQIVLGRNSAGPNPIFPTSGSDFAVGAKLTFPYSLVNDKDYSTLPDEEKYEWLEYYKLNFKGKWYTQLFSKIVLMSNAEFGFLGYYNDELGYSPFERYYVGGDGLAQFQLDGRETIGLRGYENSQVSSIQGGTIYNKFQLEVRYPITLKPSASIYALGFLEAGNSYDGFDEFKAFELKRSAGLGVRIFMPAFGLLGIDFAHGFDPLPGRIEKSGWQTHFIIGQQF